MRSGWTAVVLGSWIAAHAALAPEVVGAQSLCGDDVQETFSFTGALQTWTVPPDVTQVEIRALGAGAGIAVGPDPPGDPIPIAVPGGVGVPVRASFPVSPGEMLTILVGGRGEDVSEADNNGGGGGGSFVYRTADVAGLLVAAGGGASGDPALATGSGIGLAAPHSM